MSLFGGGGNSNKGKVATTAVAHPEGLQPNQFALQMFGPGGSGGRASPIGFDSPGLAQQIAGLQTGTSPQQPAPAPGAPAQGPDPWASMGPFGQFFKMIDEKRVAAGLPSMIGEDGKPRFALGSAGSDSGP